MGACATHCHFEIWDTANALPNPQHKNIPDLVRALKAYEQAGYSHVAVTEHGSFASYEDLRALCKHKDYGINLKVIPGIEGYIKVTKFTNKENTKDNTDEVIEAVENNPETESFYMEESLFSEEEFAVLSLEEIKERLEDVKDSI